MHELMLDPTQRKYNIKCKVLIKSINVEDVVAGGESKKFDRTVVYLIPEKNDQGVAFLNAWLPDVNAKDEFHEIAMFMKSQFFEPFRGAICRDNDNCREHHIYMMTKGLEEAIINAKLNGKTLDVIVLPENAEDETENQRDSDGSFDVL